MRSRNFGSIFNGISNGILVPLADMLNHSRPRQTSWEYKQDEEAFVITALTHLRKGDQVLDSYGRRDNRRLFFCYGFVEDDNLDGNMCSPNTTLIAILPRHPEQLADATAPEECVRSSTEERKLDEDEDCGFFWNSIVLDVMEKVDEGSEVDEDPVQFAFPDKTQTNFGAILSYRSQWLLKNSQVFNGNTVILPDDLHYDHSDSRYLHLSMCHDDTGTTTAFGIISLRPHQSFLTRSCACCWRRRSSSTRWSERCRCTRRRTRSLSCAARCRWRTSSWC